MYVDVDDIYIYIYRKFGYEKAKLISIYYFILFLMFLLVCCSGSAGSTLHPRQDEGDGCREPQISIAAKSAACGL